MPTPSILLIIPPLTQLNTPYPSTAYLTGFLRLRGYTVHQADVGIEMVLALFSKSGLQRVFEALRSRIDADLPGEARQMLSLSQAYVETIDPVIQFLQGHDPTLATRICQGEFLPQGPRFANDDSTSSLHGRSENQTDRAKHLATLYLEDLADLVQATISPHFALSRYAESIAMGASSFDPIAEALASPPSLPDELMLNAMWRHVEKCQPSIVGLTVPFPGNLYGGLRMGQALKSKYPDITIVLGGGYPNTELRRVSDPRVFDCVDYITMDDGELPMLCLLEHLDGSRAEADLCRTFLRSKDKVVWRDGAKEHSPTMAELGTPTYSGLNLTQYLSILDTLNPMHRLWSDGHWNKLTVAHGCYWKQCTFCDVGLDYIGRYEAAPSDILVYRIEAMMAETGTRGFHFVDEAAPPAGLKQLALTLLERRVTISWWGNVRFEPAFTPDLCRLLAASGCIALTAGLEAASDRLLAEMKKGITVDQTVRVAQACRQAGILIHAYLMYGLPGQTIDEAVDSLERVRQLFAHDLIQSAFWHRFSATAHSPIGLNPNRYGIRRLGPTFGGFAENDLIFADVKGQLQDWVGQGLRSALRQYIEGEALEQDVRAWFTEPVSKVHVRRDWVKRIMATPYPEDPSLSERRFVWIGGEPYQEQLKGNRSRVFLPSRTMDETCTLPRGEAEWLLDLIHRSTPHIADKGHSYPTLKDTRAKYPKGGAEKFDTMLHSSGFEKARSIGLLLV
jgi:radical SAM superfamily enzyme YgiQ (UPF0313 family)